VSRDGAAESRDGVALTNLDQPLFDGAEASKRDLVDYLDAVRASISTTRAEAKTSDEGWIASIHPAGRPPYCRSLD
jgi:hypothetical protein